ncbi:hypothetical protein RB620_00980 [Paenibacillus sp. LHD-117]|uniref:hypothetical protein n=1 Tax=Paenibacillus sp. LHD-117 TaxID=3071412 RepID=UPI0027E0A3F3|nr:hypothetical protein [Paenibacillus sp. LHD-117]MDQ6417998.1 hypothetical protein [Paenibacillus sp. LHD-117]
MKIGAAGLMKLSEMICGDQPFDFFPYRSSSNLTRFFVSIDLDYVHDGSTRRIWVNDVLTELNNKASRQDNMPSQGIINIIEYLLHPDHFLFDESVDRNKALEAVQLCMKTYNLTIAEQANGIAKVRPLNGEFISTAYAEVPIEKLITFKPDVFQVPTKPQNQRLVSVMMPFSAQFNGTFQAIKKVTDYMGLECLRADDIWDNTTFIQDIFDLIFCSKIVIVDFSGRNSNVMYETGIAHTLGKTVIPITQSISDIPSDLGHHRALVYLSNEQGLSQLSKDLYKRMKVLISEVQI